MYGGNKMWYIFYPKKKTEKVLVLKSRPTRKRCNEFGFAEGPFKNLKQVKRRLNQMNIPIERRTKRGI